MGEAVAWWIAIELLGLVALPIAAVVLRALPDRGYCVSKPLGLLLTGWLAYTLAMTGVVPFTRPMLAGCVVVLAAGSVALLLRNGRAGWMALRAQFRTPAFLRYLLTSEILFTLAFAVWAYLRAYNPNIVDQEKFMDFGFLNAILRSGTFPPHDMWLAGQSINYYYFGYVLVAAWTSLSGVPSQVAFNLADAGLFALTALGAFGIVFNLIAGTLQRQYSAARPRRATATRGALPVTAQAARAAGDPGVPVRRARAAGSATAAVETAPAAATTGADGDGAAEPAPPVAAPAGNGAHAVTPAADDDGGASWRLPRLPVFLSPYVYALLAALMIVAMGNLTTAFAIHTDNTDEGNGWRYCFLCQTPQNFNWFAPSRIIQDYRTVAVAGGPATKEKVGFETINEFPAFSFLLGDLHPHVLALPLVLLALAFGVALARRRPRSGSGWRDGLPGGLDGWLGIALAAISAGALYTANTWDYPTYLLIMLGCLALPYLAGRRRSDPAGGWRWARPWIVQAALLVVLSLVVFLPFHLTFTSLVGGDAAPIAPNLAQIPILGGILQKIGALLLVNTADKTILGFLVIFGVFLLAILAWVAFEAIRYGRTRAQRAEEETPSRIFAVWGGGLLVVLVLAWLLRFPLLALLLPLGVAALYLIWQQPGRPERNTVLLLVAVGAFLGLVIEVFFLRDNFQMRMNTLFKFYFQIWVLWGLAAAYAMWRALHTVFRDTRAAAPGQVSGAKALAAGWAAVFALLVVSGLLYSVYGPLARQVGGQAAPRGLDGMAWLRDAVPDDYAAISWLKDQATSNDVVLEAGSDEYNRPGRVSAYTGVPTLVAWDNSHESLWRTGQPALRAQIQERRQVVNAIYQGRDPRDGQPLTAQRLLDLLHQYGVDYVFAGATERGVPGFAPSKPEEQMTPYAEGLFKQALPEAFHSGSTVIFAVKEGIAGTGIAPAPPGTTPAPGAVATVDASAPPAALFDAGGPGAGRGQFNLPRGIARDAGGNFYVADTQNLRIEKFDPAGTFITLFGGAGNGPGQFAPLRPDAQGTGPGGVAVDAVGNVYVADTWNHRIQKFDPTGKFLLQWGSFVDLSDPNGANAANANTGFYGPRGVAIGSDGNVYVTDTGNKRVLIFDANGAFQRAISSGVSPSRKAPDYPFTQPGELNEPIGIAVDGDGNAYVADTNNRRIQKFTAAGAPAAQWPVPAGSWEPGPYLEPFLAVDRAGNLYATAPTSHSVLKFSPTGALLGQKSAQGDATLQLPTGLTVDDKGTVYVVDTTAGRVVNLGTIP